MDVEMKISHITAYTIIVAILTVTLFSAGCVGHIHTDHDKGNCPICAVYSAIEKTTSAALIAGILCTACRIILAARQFYASVNIPKQKSLVALKVRIDD